MPQAYKTFYLKTNFRTFLNNLTTSTLMCDQFIQNIVSTGYSNCYLEFPMISLKILDSDDMAEYTIIEASSFPDADWTLFSDKIKSNNNKNQNNNKKKAMFFSNISSDAMLVIPIPTTKQKIDMFSGDLMTFLKHGQKKQQREVVQLCAITALKLIESQQSIYISTHGRGVAWLHIRLSTVPKYYMHKKYLHDKT